MTASKARLRMAEALTSAAREAGIPIPETITLPHANGSVFHPCRSGCSFFRPGTSHISRMPGFASGDTDVTTGRNITKSRTGTSDIINKSKMMYTPPDDLTDVPRQDVRRAVLLSVAGIVIANMLMLWLSGIFGWKVFGHTWPMELVVVGILLAALMSSLPSAWMLIPAGIVLGNGFLFSYYALSGYWQHWTFLWPLEPLLVARLDYCTFPA